MPIFFGSYLFDKSALILIIVRKIADLFADLYWGIRPALAGLIALCTEGAFADEAHVRFHRLGVPAPASALFMQTSKMCQILHILLHMTLKGQNTAHMIDVIEIAEQIRVARKQMKMTQAQLATAARISRRAVIELEAGRSPDPGFITVVRIMRAVGLDLRITQFNHHRPTFEDLLAEQKLER